jgi:hypothetical protein
VSEYPPELFAPSATIIADKGLPFALISQVQMALTEIDLVHRVPKRIQASLVQCSKRREEGSYDPQLTQIAISRFAKDPIGTFIHEYGHFLDNRQLHPLRNEYASRYDLDFDPLMAACFRSAPVRGITGLLRNRKYRLNRADAAFLNEAIEAHEVFARAYGQWICSKSYNFLLQASLRRRIQARMPFGGEYIRLHWDTVEFADIMAEMDRLFQKKGLS